MTKPIGQLLTRPTMSLLFAMSTLVLFVSSCAVKVPTQRVWLPWTRTIDSGDPIPTKSRLKTVVSGKTSPLLGNESLIASSIKSELDYLLKRRGFSIDDTNWDLVLEVDYQTLRSDKQVGSSISYSSNRSSFSSSSSHAKTGFGVMIASAISRASAKSLSVNVQSTETVVFYTHTVSLEISDPRDSLRWKGESTWDTHDLDVTIEVLPALQLLISELPSSGSYIPMVHKVKETHALNFFELMCENRIFTCPALPYEIGFKERLKLKSIRDVPEVVDHSAFAAYIDLIQTAEYALPMGNKNFDYPLRRSLWSEVRLGGKYILGDSSAPVYVLIDLKGYPSGYAIEYCRIVPEEKWRQFNSKMDEWREALREFYDYYEPR